MQTPKSDFEFNGKKYRLLPRKCTKRPCKCESGKPHGFYWYSFGDDGTKYVGKELPAELLVKLSQLHDGQEKIKKTIQRLKTKEALQYKLLQSTQENIRELESLSHGGEFDDKNLEIQNLKIFKVLL